MKASKKKCQKQSFGQTKYTVGVEVPRTGDIKGAMRSDRKHEHIMPDGFDLTWYQYVSLIYAWGVKYNGQRRARLVAIGKVTIGPLESEAWSGVVNTESVRTVMLIVAGRIAVDLAVELCYKLKMLGVPVK
eukprot:7186216-Ditylum_brightwellii.AAC.1